MNQLIQLNTSKLVQEYRETGKFILPTPYHNKKNAFLMHSLSLFSTIPLVKNTLGKISMHKTIAAIPETHHASGVAFSRSKVIELLWIAAHVNRTKLLSTSQVKTPKYGALTPLFMYAHKRDNKVSYKDWDYNDVKISAALGEFLAKANIFRKDYPYMFLESTPILRSSLAKGRKYTEWNAYCGYKVTLDPVDDEDVGESIVIPKEISIMHNQFWIANAELRDTGTMLLDLFNIGMVPKAIDAIAPMTNASLEELL